MRILAIYRHYWPDATPYALLLKAILERAASEGHEVAVLAAQPSYNDVARERRPAREQVGGVSIRRVGLLAERKSQLLQRVVNELMFLLRAMAHVLWDGRYDVIVANSRPPLITACGLLMIRKLTGTPYILHLQDIHPEGLHAVGKLRSGAVYQLLQRLDAVCCRHAQQIVTLSHDMAAALESRRVELPPVAVINNAPLSAPAGEAGELPAVFATRDHVPLLLFAGNLGDFQALDLVVDAAREMAAERRFRLVFLGAGAARTRLMSRAADQLDRTILFLPYVSPAAARRAMERSDFAVVSLAPEVFRYAYPSKSMTYLAAGCPLVALVEPTSELARTIVAEELGYVAREHSAAAMAAAMRTACSEAAVWNNARRSELARRGERLFGEERMLAKWMEIFAACGRWAEQPASAETARPPERTAVGTAA